MSAAPQVTVFSCWYNRMEGLEESVRSILDQTGVELEYVIVDDASTDGTAERLQAIRDPRLRVLRNPQNIGFVRSANRAVRAGVGHYVAVHGAGDISLPGRLERQVAFLDRNSRAVAVGVGVESHNLVSGRRYRLDSTQGEKDELRYTYSHGEVMFRRPPFEQVGGYREIFYYTQDKDLWHRLSEHGELGLIEELLYHRRVTEDGVAQDPVKIARQAIFSNLMMHSAAERRHGRPDPVARYHALALLTQPGTERFRRRMRRLIRELLKKGEIRQAREALETAPVGMLSSGELGLLLALRGMTAFRRGT